MRECPTCRQMFDRFDRLIVREDKGGEMDHSHLVLLNGVLPRGILAAPTPTTTHTGATTMTTYTDRNGLIVDPTTGQRYHPFDDQTGELLPCGNRSCRRCGGTWKTLARLNATRIR